ncbi:MAG: asparagine synthase (glutamine-hydrolyzing) [bacterium]|nr:asparagine synthase (glutamine-hydrolyzing) [bacterium]
MHDPELLGPMTDAMIHRGPDDSGTWCDPEAEIGLGHRRLSIIDLSPAGRQPMCNADRSIWITYNGELYNYPEHRERLVQKGYPFRSNSDTEVLLALYETMGLDFLQELNGIFAFALWDAKERRLVLARDHAGVKPLYYRQDGRKLYFASEIKALLRVPGASRELHMPSVPDYLTFLWVPGENTLLAGIKKLEPGHYAVWQDGRLSTKRWFDLEYQPDESLTEAQWVEAVHDTFMRTTERQMVSDVPLGAFLSGGLDSSSIVACMRNVFPERVINTYTVRFDRGAMAKEQGVDDYPYARKVAKALDVRLKSVMLHPDVISLLPKMVYHLDEPDADPAVFPSYLISKLAREDGTTVLLSGTGGDEVFFGYRSHQAYRLYERFAWMSRFPFSSLISAGVEMSSSVLGAQNRYARRIAKFRRGLMQRGLERHLEVSDWSSHRVREGLFDDAVFDSLRSWDSSECMRRYHEAFRGEGELNLHSHLLVQTFLAAHNFLYTDKSSMAVGLEARVPFMDVELMRLSARIPERYKLKNNVTKSVLKDAMERYLPRDLIHRKKTGFGAPLRTWIQEDLHDTIQFFLGPGQVSRRGIFKPEQVRRILDENAAGTSDHAYLIYALVNLELWMQSFIDAPGEEVTL